MPEILNPGFLDLPPERQDYATCRFAVLPLPYDATCSYGVGTRFGPARIIEASAQVETWDDELRRDASEQGVCTVRQPETMVSGPGPYLDVVAEAAREILADGKFLVGLGGEHSVTCGVMRAFHAFHPRVTVVQIDAHLDLRSSYQGTPWSHACAMRRIVEMGLPIVQVGVRSGSEEDWAFAAEQRIPVFRAQDVVRLPDEAWMQAVVDAISTDEVYVTVDLDGFDPSVIPATGTPEPGGLGWYQGLALLRRIATARKLLGFDVVELEPIPGNRVADFAAARLVYKMMGYAGE